MPNNIKRHNHYVPEMYLKNWAQSNKIIVYNLLVPHKNVPIWTTNSLSHSASIDNLYVRQLNGKELDDFENYFMCKYETPASEPLTKACNGKKLSIHDWHILIEFIAAQIVRTPAFYFKQKDIMNKIVPSALESIGNSINNLSSEQLKTHHQSYHNDVENLIPVKIRFLNSESEDAHSQVEIETVVGKSIWLMNIQNLLSKLPQILWQNKWSIMTAASGITWPTTDDPVILLHVDANGDYRFDGKWDEKGNEIIFPICPTKALYTQIGNKQQPRINLTMDESLKIKRLIVMHALRYVYSIDKDDSIPLIRPRDINLTEYLRLKKEFDGWYETYTNGEVPFLSFH